MFFLFNATENNNVTMILLTPRLAYAGYIIIHFFLFLYLSVCKNYSVIYNEISYFPWTSNILHASQL